MPGSIYELFAGGGGASTGIAMALGRSPDGVLDISKLALAMHKANHPNSEHVCADIYKLQPQAVTKGGRINLIWTSPECTNHSVARGGGRRDAKSRDMAWAVYKWILETRPTVVILENVPGFRDWGPCGADGFPIKGKKGQHFREFLRALRRLGYKVEHRLLRADDFGAATIRKRLFLVARLDRKPVWPVPTHGPGRANPYTPVSACVDLANMGPSVFGRKKTLSAPTQGCIAEGIVRYNGEPFIKTYYGLKKQGEFRGCGIADQVGTQTTANRHYLVTPLRIGADEGAAPRFHGPVQDVASYAALLDCMAQNGIADVHYRALTPCELFRIQGFPEGYIIDEGVAADGTPVRLTRTDKLRSCGNSVCPPVAAALVRANYTEDRPALPSLPLLAWLANESKTEVASAAMDVGSEEDVVMADQEVAAAWLDEFREAESAETELLASETQHAEVQALEAGEAKGAPALEHSTVPKRPYKKCFSHDRVVNGKDEWLTPKHLLERLGSFDLDPCAPVVRPWSTAAKHYTVHDNGLIQEWHGRVWLNPPYGTQTASWLARLAMHRNGIALVFARVDTKAFHEWVWPEADAVLFLRGRITFYNVDGTAASGPAGAPSALIAYGKKNVECLAALKDLGAFIKRPVVRRSAKRAVQMEMAE
ncbi:DNA N-6-adenine-methyltransferase [Humidesulfovibrio sp.]